MGWGEVPPDAAKEKGKEEEKGNSFSGAQSERRHFSNQKRVPFTFGHSPDQNNVRRLLHDDHNFVFFARHHTRPANMREIVHMQAGQCGNQIGAKVHDLHALLIRSHAVRARPGPRPRGRGCQPSLRVSVWAPLFWRPGGQSFVA